MLALSRSVGGAVPFAIWIASWRSLSVSGAFQSMMSSSIASGGHTLRRRVLITPQSLEGLLVAGDVVRLFRNPRPMNFEPLVVASPAADSLVDAALERNRVAIAIVEESDFRMENLPIVRGRARIGDFDVDSAFAGGDAPKCGGSHPSVRRPGPRDFPRDGR